MQSPAWNSLAPELVPSNELESAIALSGAGFNCARGAGAALGGLLVAQLGPGWVFLLNALLMIAMWTAIFRWQRAKTKIEMPERVIGAMKAGLRYVRHSKPLRNVLARTTVFVFCASALWALLPLLARTEFKLNSTQYGIMLSIFGIGTLLGASILPRFRRSVSLDRLAATGTALFAAGMFCVALFHIFALACLAMFSAGMGWIFVCGAINSSMLMASPAWVRARSVAIYLLVFQGCLAFGSLMWGFVATQVSMSTALIYAGFGLLVSLALSFRYKLTGVETLDMRASGPWPRVETEITPHPDHGPVLVTREYIIDSKKVEEFVEAMAALEKHRRRNGASHWHLFIDLTRPGVYTESYFVDTWAEHLRQRDRATQDDISAEQRVCAYHIGENEPQVKHMLSERRRSKQ